MFAVKHVRCQCDIPRQKYCFMSHVESNRTFPTSAASYLRHADETLVLLFMIPD